MKKSAQKDDEEFVSVTINLLKRITKLETRLDVIEAALTGKFKVAVPQDDDWARRIILKIIEWLFIIVAAIVGAKLTRL